MGSQAMFIGMNGTTVYGGAYANDLSYASFWAAGTWKQVCLTYDGTNASLYGNGSILTMAAKTWNLVKSSAYIGKQVGAGGEYWKGSVDEVLLFDRALTADEIGLLYNATVVSRTGCRTTKTLAQNKWTHLGGTYDGSTLKLFTDGVERCSMTAASGFSSPSTDLTMAGRADGSRTWSGDVAHLAFYGNASVSNVTTHRLATM
ncbi:MAG: LamG-like jellyroll fold domain-containing protein, partial [Bdellovibrionota bacterium]